MSIRLDDVTDLTIDMVQRQYIAAINMLLVHARDLLKLTLTANKDVAVTVGLVAAILQRIIECSTSINILACHKRARDTAILLLNLIELRVDLQYVALCMDHELEWLAHRNEWHKPWKLSTQIRKIFTDEHERQNEIDMYHFCSMIKHGSPAKDVSWLSKMINNDTPRGGVAFNITCDEDKLLIDQGRFSHMTGILLFATGLNVRQSCRAVAQILSRRGLAFPEVEKKLDETTKTLKVINEADCLRHIVEWARAHNPEFDRLCKEHDRLVIEREKANQTLNEARKRLAEME